MPKSKNASQTDVDSIVRYFHDTVEYDFTYAEIPTLVIKAMKHVQSFKGMKGEQKKALVIEVVTRLIDESDVCGPMEPVILSVIPTMIDSIVSVDKGQLRIKPKLMDKMKSIASCECVPK